MKNLNLIEDHIWSEVELVLCSYKDGTFELLLDRFESSKADRKKQLDTFQGEVDRCDLEKQRLITAVGKGYFEEADAELQFRHLKEEQGYWHEELANLLALDNNTDAAWNSFWNQLKALKVYDYFGFDISLEKKREFLDLLLHEFILFNDGQIELRFKLPADEKQVASTILTLSNGVIAIYCKTSPAYLPLHLIRRKC